MKIINALFHALLTVLFLFSVSCDRQDGPALYNKGIFPDTLLPLNNINSEYDDYNSDINAFTRAVPIIFSSNRGSLGEQFDLVYGVFTYIFLRETGEFTLKAEPEVDNFLSGLVSIVNTPRDEFGPYRLYSAINGFEYLVVSSVNESGDLDFQYVRNFPYFGSTVPVPEGPWPVRLLNSHNDEGYFCFDTDQDTAYFTRKEEGDFDIYLHPKDPSLTIDEWFSLEYEESVKASGLNSEGNDKCPYVYRNVMVFASDRSGGMGGYDLYYSVFSAGKWSSPVNFGPRVNSSSNEYRPVLGGDEEFSNQFMIFSSDRPGGKGGFDLYFTGVKLAG